MGDNLNMCKRWDRSSQTVTRHVMGTGTYELYLIWKRNDPVLGCTPLGPRRTPKSKKPLQPHIFSFSITAFYRQRAWRLLHSYRIIYINKRVNSYSKVSLRYLTYINIKPLWNRNNLIKWIRWLVGSIRSKYLTLFVCGVMTTQSPGALKLHEFQNSRSILSQPKNFAMKNSITTRRSWGNYFDCDNILLRPRSDFDLSAIFLQRIQIFSRIKFLILSLGIAVYV